MHSLRALLERLGRSIPALARGIDRVFHRRRHPTLNLDAITADDLDEADDEPLPAYRRWAIDALGPPPAYAERPAEPPPSYAETVRHDLLGTAAASNRPRRVSFDVDAKPRRRCRCRPCAARRPLCAGVVVVRQQRLPAPSPSQQQQQDQERQQQRQEVLESLLVPAQRAMLSRRLRVPPKIARTASTSSIGGATFGNGGGGGEGCLRDAC
ncbi:hypothetical protein C7999DRAFT_31890 [Corynascus novoguineensis]|uniref:Uncharacterized protein n=1 Tax=Corynascus novoguineensis TaxID=1126955 RepID=A0AAN7HJ74_9PEZI|nr:hypothetical protein C7999DRAFT_31890 [Corynascus novoguineensis]